MKMDLRQLRSSKQHCKHAFFKRSLLLILLLSALASGKGSGDDKPDRYDDKLNLIRADQYLPFAD